MKITDKALYIYKDETMVVAKLYDENPLRLEYAVEWLNHQGDALSPHLPTTQINYTGDKVENFVENLLPEGARRAAFSEATHQDSLFNLISFFGGETSSIFTFRKSWIDELETSYQRSSWEEINQFISETKNLYNLDDEAIKAGLRYSMAGVQDKATLHVDESGIPYMLKEHSVSTYILKFQIKNDHDIEQSSLNEVYAMKLARWVGLKVAQVVFQPQTKSCLVKRFDREKLERNLYRKIPHFDICQLMNMPSGLKYEHEGGPSLQQIFQILNQYHINAAEKKQFIQWIIFNILIGNNDSHAKNLSLFVPKNGQAVLTPFYDLMCTSYYARLSKEFAFSLGHEKMRARFNYDCLNDLAATMGVKLGYLAKIVNELNAKIHLHAIAVIQEMKSEHQLSTSQENFLYRLSSHIKKESQKMSAQLIKTE